jgi:hypothetical protein
MRTGNAPVILLDSMKTIKYLATTDSRTRGDRKRERRGMLIDLMWSKRAEGWT